MTWREHVLGLIESVQHWYINCFRRCRCEAFGYGKCIACGKYFYKWMEDLP